jgi:hypothetical protein
MNRTLLDPRRERRIETPFGFIPFRLLTDGHLPRMSLPEIALYLFLSLAADRRGLSFCSDRHLADVLRLTHDEIKCARCSLKKKGLLLFKPERYHLIYQLLSLPDRTAASESTTPAATQPQAAPPPQPSERAQLNLAKARQIIALLSDKTSLPQGNSGLRNVR